MGGGEFYGAEFEWLGLLILGVSSVLQVFALAMGPTEILGLNVFDIHSEALLLLAALTDGVNGSNPAPAPAVVRNFLRSISPLPGLLR